MLEWNPRLVTLVLALVAIGALAGDLRTFLGHLGW